MTAQVLYNRVTLAIRHRLHGFANDVERTSRAHFGNGLMHRFCDSGAYFLPLSVSFTHGKGLPHVCDKAVEVCRHINVDHIAVMQLQVSRNTMGGLMIDRNTGGPWKIVVQLGCRTRAILRQHTRTYLVQSSGGDTRLTGRIHGIKRRTHRGSRLFHPLHLAGCSCVQNNLISFVG